MAKTGLSWFSPFLTTGQIDGGENVSRLTGDGGMYWHDANTVEMLADYTIATGDQTYVQNLQAYRGYNGIYNYGTPPPASLPLYTGENGFNDDKLWWALAMIRIYDALGDPAYLQNAEMIFSNVCGYWSYKFESCGGGVVWTEGGNYLNAVTNELFFETAARLALRDPAAVNVCGALPLEKSPGGALKTFPPTYVGWAEAEWQWFKDYWFPASSTSSSPNASRLPLKDGLGSDCIPGDSGPGGGPAVVWTYNQGIILGALTDLVTIKNKGWDGGFLEPAATLEQFAFEIAETAMAQLSENVNGVSILTEGCDDGSAHDCLTQDYPQFKGIFMRYLGRLAAAATPQVAGDASYAAFQGPAVTFLEQNANQIYQMGVKLQKGVTNLSMFPEKWSIDEWEAPQYYQTSQTSALDAIIAAIGQYVVAMPTVCPVVMATTPVCTVSRTCAQPGSEIVSCTTPPTGISQVIENNTARGTAVGTTLMYTLPLSGTYQVCNVDTCSNTEACQTIAEPAAPTCGPVCPVCPSGTVCEVVSPGLAECVANHTCPIGTHFCNGACVAGTGGCP